MVTAPGQGRREGSGSVIPCTRCVELGGDRRCRGECDLSAEAPEADPLEQAAPVDPSSEDDGDDPVGDAPEADALEQRRGFDDQDVDDRRWPSTDIVRRVPSNRRPRKNRSAGAPSRPPAVDVVELRVLDGPNIYFPRPAVKLTLSVPGWQRATTERLDRLADELDLPPSVRSGDRRTEQRLRFASRVAAHCARSIAAMAGTRLGVRGRAAGAERIVVAFPWRRRGTAEALGSEVAQAMLALLRTRRRPDRIFADSARRVAAAEPGDGPRVPEPTIPVIAVTGTNGKTTTVRLLAHLLRTADRSVAYSSTDGVYRDGALVEAGDYSGFAGAGMALSQPGVDVAVLETARGGILLRGIGTMHNDVAVVTNISSDHLGLNDIETLDQLAEVKQAITRITRPDGWDVLNADDPRVLAMRRGATGRPFPCSFDPNHPAIREALADDGRAMTVLDGWLVALGPGAALRRLVPLEDVPVTLAGIATHHVQNAMAATSAALAVGAPEDAVVRGIRTFRQTPESNPGRANVYTLDERVVVVDYAHNEAGMIGLTEILAGLRPPDGRIWLAYCAAGDRQDDVLHALGYRAARRADHPIVAGLPHYLRGRDPEDLAQRLRAGAVDAGATDVPIVADEMAALTLMLQRSGRLDVIGLTALGQRPEIFAELERRGAVLADPDTIRRLVRRARGYAGGRPGPRERLRRASSSSHTSDA
jgi:cyanophycin synthetase